MQAEQTATRVEGIARSIRESMLRRKTHWKDVGSLFEDDPAVAERPLIVRNAMAAKKKLTIAPIGIWPGQLIAGGVTLNSCDTLITGALPVYATEDEVRAAAAEGYSVGSIVGHIVPSYPKLLTMGAEGIRADAWNRMRSARDEDEAAFFEACVLAMEGLMIYARRNAELCQALAVGERDAVRAGELRAMAADLRAAPANPAASFTQAVRAIWLTHAAFQLTGNSLAIGRFDQHVWPYLESDLRNGAISEADAQEVVDCFFLKFNERSVDSGIPRASTSFAEAREKNERNWAKRTPFDHTTQRTNVRDSIDATNHWLQNVIIGGVRPSDGEDATNPVTYMCLSAFEKNRMTNPCLTIRLSERTPDELLSRACEVLREGGGLPAFFNDEAIIPALTAWGIELEDARDYTNDGCWEIILAGRNDFYFDRFNMLRCLEWALNRGVSRVDDKTEAPDPGDPASFASYEEVYGAFVRLLAYEIEGLMAKNHNNFGKRSRIAPVPLLSALLEGPMERGGDMTAVGAKYVTYGLIAEGASHVIDSLAAIQKVVFGDRATDMAGLIRALDDNFAGHEALREKLLAAPKYGRSESEADEIGARVFRDFADIVRELNPAYHNITFLPGAGTFSWYIAIGEGCGASPDGRLSGDEVASNFSPSAGAATRGVTGSILSHAAVDMNNLPVGSPNDLRISSRLVAGKDGLNRLTGIIKSFVKLGGNMLTLTVADTALLRAAQREPEKYRDLRVRMGGWSAYFTMLSTEQQEHHIHKQEQL